MAIRYEALKRLAHVGRRVYRVRRRGWDEPRFLDTDGEHGKPWTWARSMDEYFSQYAYAAKSAEDNDWRGAGYIDQQKAVHVLAMYEQDYRERGEDLTDYEDGRLRVLREVRVSGRRIV